MCFVYSKQVLSTHALFVPGEGCGLHTSECIPQISRAFSRFEISIKQKLREGFHMKFSKNIISTICIFITGLCLIATVSYCLTLEQGSIGHKLIIAGLLVLLATLGLFLLWHEGVDQNELLIMTSVLGLAMLVRILCLDYISGDYSVFLSRWYVYFRDNGGFSALPGSVGNYNVPYLYFMATISYFDIPDLYLIKLFSVSFDILLAWGGFRLTYILQEKTKGMVIPLITFTVMLFLPAVVINGAYWGQCDAIYGALTLHALAQLLEGKNKSSVALLAVAFSFKLQTIFLIPLWGVQWFAKRVKFWDLLVFPLTYGITIIPALLLGKPLRDILSIYSGQIGEYSSLTLNAPSIFQLIPYGINVNDKLLSTLGIVCAAILVFLLFALGLWLGHRLNVQTIMTMAVALSIGVPFFLPHMHERYFFLADVFTICSACTNFKRIPCAVLVCASSLASYCVYLRLKYNYVVQLGNFQFVMLLEMMAMLAGLVLSLIIMFREVQHCSM